MRVSASQYQFFRLARKARQATAAAFELGPSMTSCRGCLPWRVPKNWVFGKAGPLALATDKVPQKATRALTFAQDCGHRASLMATAACPDCR